MNGKCFLDSNIIVYAHTDPDLLKQEVAQKIIARENIVISTQALQESVNILFKKFQFTWPHIQTVLIETWTNNFLRTNSNTRIAYAFRIADRYGFSFYDSLIIAAVLESGCERLISDDLQNKQIIDGLLTIENSFAI